MTQEFNLGRVKGETGETGARAWVRYNTSPQDEGSTTTWSTGQNYIGVQTSTATTSPATGYTWSLFIPEAVGVRTFDIAISTQSEFDALILSPTWLDAISVAFIGQFSTSVATGIKIPQTVKQIRGFNSAKITITDFLYNSTTAKGGLWYDILPTTRDYSISDLTVECNSIGVTFQSGQAIGINNCTQLTNCTGTGISTSGGSGIGISECTHLINCTGNGLNIDTGGGYCVGISACTQLINCVGYGKRFYAGNSYGINNCTQLTNCVGTGIGATASYGFIGCRWINGCKGSVENATGGSSGAFLGGANVRVDNSTVAATPS